MTQTLLVAVIIGLIVFDIFAMTIGVDSREWEAKTLGHTLHPDR